MLKNQSRNQSQGPVGRSNRWTIRDKITLLQGRTGRNSDILVDVIVALYIGGLLIYHSRALFGGTYWDAVYYIWDNLKDWLCFFYIAGKTKRKLALFFVLIYATIRLCLEITANIIQVTPNVWWITDLLWTILVGCLVYLSWRELRNDINRLKEP